MPAVKDGEVTADLEDTGDGTVPYWAADPPFIESCRLVCVSPEDFGYWELRDRFLGRYLSNLHGMLPAMNLVIKLSVAFLSSEQGQKAKGYPGIRGRRAPHCLKRGQDWDPPFRELEEEVPEGIGGIG